MSCLNVTINKGESTAGVALMAIGFSGFVLTGVVYGRNSATATSAHYTNFGSGGTAVVGSTAKVSTTTASINTQTGVGSNLADCQCCGGYRNYLWTAGGFFVSGIVGLGIFEGSRGCAPNSTASERRAIVESIDESIKNNNHYPIRSESQSPLNINIQGSDTKKEDIHEIVSNSHLTIGDSNDFSNEIN